MLSVESGKEIYGCLLYIFSFNVAKILLEGGNDAYEQPWKRANVIL